MAPLTISNALSHWRYEGELDYTYASVWTNGRVDIVPIFKYLKTPVFVPVSNAHLLEAREWQENELVRRAISKSTSAIKAPSELVAGDKITTRKSYVSRDNQDTVRVPAGSKGTVFWTGTNSHGTLRVGVSLDDDDLSDVFFPLNCIRLDKTVLLDADVRPAAIEQSWKCNFQRLGTTLIFSEGTRLQSLRENHDC